MIRFRGILLHILTLRIVCYKKRILQKMESALTSITSLDAIDMVGSKIQKIIFNFGNTADVLNCI